MKTMEWKVIIPVYGKYGQLKEIRKRQKNSNVVSIKQILLEMYFILFSFEKTHRGELSN